MTIKALLVKIQGNYSRVIARNLTLKSAWKLLGLISSPDSTACYLVEARSSQLKGDKMQIQQITYQKVVNLGNFNSHRFEATATVEDGEDVYESARLLQKFVNWSLGTSEADQQDSEKIDYNNF